MCSCRDSEDMANFGRLFSVLKLVGQCPQDQCFDLRDGLLLGRAVRHRSPENGNLGNPTPVFFSFDFDLHDRTVVATPGVGKRVLLPPNSSIRSN